MRSRTENPGVGGSIPSLPTIPLIYASSGTKSKNPSVGPSLPPFFFKSLRRAAAPKAIDSALDFALRRTCERLGRLSQGPDPRAAAVTGRSYEVSLRAGSTPSPTCTSLSRLR